MKSTQLFASFIAFRTVHSVVVLICPLTKQFVCLSPLSRCQSIICHLLFFCDVSVSEDCSAFFLHSCPDLVDTVAVCLRDWVLWDVTFCLPYCLIPKDESTWWITRPATRRHIPEHSNSQQQCWDNQKFLNAVVYRLASYDQAGCSRQAVCTRVGILILATPL